MEDMQVENKSFLTTREVAERLGLSPTTLRIWRTNGTGPRFYRFHRSIFYKREDVDAWIGENYQLVELRN